jgi:hypothetical protein
LPQLLADPEQPKAHFGVHGFLVFCPIKPDAVVYHIASDDPCITFPMYRNLCQGGSSVLYDVKTKFSEALK